MSTQSPRNSNTSPKTPIDAETRDVIRLIAKTDGIPAAVREYQILRQCSQRTAIKAVKIIKKEPK